MKRYVVGIAGGSASGKTYVLNQLITSFRPDELTLISLDNYYLPRHKQQVDPSSGEVNWDQPAALDLDLCLRHLERLVKGRGASVKEYTFNNPAIVPRTIRYTPTPIIVIEGLYVFNDPRIRDLLDLKVFIDAEEHVKLARRIRRDMIERSADLEFVLKQYEEHVVPMYHRHVEPYKYNSDIILPNSSVQGKGVEVLVSHLKSQLHTKQLTKVTKPKKA